jgi:sugar phosphate permease
MKIFSTLSFISILFLSKCFSKFFTTALFFLIKFLQYSHHINMFFIIPEIYPTTFRSTAIGVINCSGKFGGVLGTGLVYVLFYQSPYLVVGMFAVAALATCVCSWIWNIETKDAEMRDVKDTSSLGETNCLSDDRAL